MDSWAGPGPELLAAPAGADGDAVSAAVGRQPDDHAISETEEPFHLLFAASPDAIVLIDPSGRDVSWPIVDCNEAACRMNGHTREELIGQSIDVLNLTVGTPSERADYLTQLRRKGVITLETYHRHKDGRVIPVEVSTSLVTVGGREFVLGVDRDISERKRQQEEQRASYEALRRADEERGRLLARLVAAHEEERLRVADEIHNDSVQVLTAVSFRLAALRTGLPPNLESKVEQLADTVEHAISRMRHLMFELRPPSLDGVGLGAALREYADRMSEDGPRVAIVGALDREPSPDVRVLLYRLAQEALTNVRKHADARNVVVSVGREDEGVFVRVVDDGTGFDHLRMPGRTSGKLGLISMRERAELAGGWFHVESVPGHGSTVSFWIPDTATGRLALGNGRASV